MEMASEIGAELLCSICLDIFKEAVTLRCGHSFCRACVTQSWQNSDRQACAVCRNESSTGEELITNHALNNVVERFLQQQQQLITDQGTVDMCMLHGEKLKIFCFDDRQLICLVCQTSRKHEKHKLRPVQEAALEQREQQQSAIRNLKVKIAKYEKSEKQHDQMKNHLQEQYVKTEKKIKADFIKFYTFLQDEEQKIISELKAEAEEKRARLDESIKEINEVITELTHIIQKLEQELQESDLHFIMKYSRKRSAISTCEDPSDLPASALIDEAKYVGGLGYNIWKEMEKIVTSLPFILDPNTAGRWLHLSDDLTSVRFSSSKELPDNPERFSPYPCVLGSVYFTRGKHHWAVDVGSTSNWDIGVCFDFVDRKMKKGCDYRTGVYCIALRGGTRYSARTQVETVLELNTQPKTIGVLLDYDFGMLAFYDLDAKKCLYNSFVPLKGKVYPYFCIGASERRKFNPFFYVGSVKRRKPRKPFRLCLLPVGNRDKWCRF